VLHISNALQPDVLKALARAHREWIEGSSDISRHQLAAKVHDQVVLQKLSEEGDGRQAPPLVQFRPPLQTGWR
jgi:hypothetical protein